MGVFRDASSLGANNYEIGASGVYNTYNAIGTLRLRYGLFKYTDLEITGLGAIGLLFNHAKYYGLGYSATYQLPFIDYIALGFQGGYSNYRNGIGPRIIIGHTEYIGIEENYLFPAKDNLGDVLEAQFTENVFIGYQIQKNIVGEFGFSIGASSIGSSAHVGVKWIFLTK
jgi:hypothetical protein